MKKIFHIIIFFGFSWLFLNTAYAADYYVSPTGNNSNLGTSSTRAWQTIDKVNTVNFAPGDKILFEGGKNFTGNMYFDLNDKGTATSPIIISNYGIGNATISIPSTKEGIVIYNTAGFNISNLNFVGQSRTDSRSGINIYNDLANNVKLDSITINNVEVSNVAEYGIVIGSWNNLAGFKNVLIQNTIVHDASKSGINTYSQSPYAHENVSVKYTKTYNISGVASDLINPTGSGIVLGGVNTGVIEHCIAYNVGYENSANSGPVGIWTYDSTKMLIQYNESHHNKTAGTADGDGFDFDQNVSNSIMQYNYSHDNDGAGYLIAHGPDNSNSTNNTIRYNISQNDARKNNYGSIMIYGRALNTNIYNNTIFTSPAPGNTPSAIKIVNYTIETHDVNNLLIANNIFYTTGSTSLIEITAQQLDSNPTIRFLGNNYFSKDNLFKIIWGNQNFTSFSNWRNSTGQEKNNTILTGSNVDPQLQNPGLGTTINNTDQLNSLTQYGLKSTSSLINTGVNLKTLFNTDPGLNDFFGTSIPQNINFDVGALEQNTVIITTTTTATSTLTSTITTTALALIGDFNNDSTVNKLDLDLILLNFQSTLSSNISTYDLNQDNKIGIIDLSILIPNLQN